MENILNKEILKWIVQKFTNNIEQFWYKHSKIVNITKHSKLWWNEECQRELENYRVSRNVEDWRKFRNVIKKTKHVFFNIKIQDIVAKICGSWELMNWVKKHILLVIKAIQYNSWPCVELENLWQAFYSSFNSAQSH